MEHCQSRFPVIYTRVRYAKTIHILEYYQEYLCCSDKQYLWPCACLLMLLCPVTLLTVSVFVTTWFSDNEIFATSPAEFEWRSAVM